MEEKKRNPEAEKEIVHSQSVKAGKRIYYIDVKKNRKDELFLAITESKKVINGEGEYPQVSFEKHKIFLYKEDLDKFADTLQQAINYIKQNQNCNPDCEDVTKPDNALPIDGEIKLDIDF